MTFHHSCRFCEIADGRFSLAEIDEPFCQSDSCLAIASIGALVEGWSLIVPKEHQLSMRNVYATPDFELLAEEVLFRLSKKYGRIIAFEHGANKEGSLTACGTDHAHLHLVPFAESLLSSMHRSGLSWVPCRFEDIRALASDEEYLFYSEDCNEGWDNPKGFIHVLQSPTSQFFRRLIAEHQDMMKVSDYKLFPHTATARRTREMLSAI